MKKTIVLAAVFALSALAGEWKGVISDAKCKHANGGGCAAKCVKGGVAPVFISDGKVYSISNAAKAVDLAGEKVKVTGKVEGETLTIDSIAKAE